MYTKLFTVQYTDLPHAIVVKLIIDPSLVFKEVVVVERDGTNTNRE